MRKPCVSSLYLSVVLPLVTTALNASEADYSEQLIQAELQRAKTAPDHVVTIDVQQPVSVVFEAMLRQLANYNEDVAGVAFNHDKSRTPGSLNAGSVRRVEMTNGQYLVQHMLVTDSPTTFAYFTDMAQSTATVPIDYSIGLYEFSALNANTTRATISVAYKPGSRLTAWFVRVGFKRALEREFDNAARYLNSTMPP